MSESFYYFESGIDDWDSFEEDYLDDPTIRDHGAGRPLTRPGVVPLLKVWRYTRSRITTADKLGADDWQANTVDIGGIPFAWQDPRPSGGVHTVRLGSPLVFHPFSGLRGYYDVDIHLIEEPTY